jgi:signal transduction histidine kinase/DNA-binding response OmpR family regulator
MVTAEKNPSEPMESDLGERLAMERRGRLAAERLLQQKSRELFAANEKLAMHARSLFNQMVEHRTTAQTALSQAETLKGQADRITGDLDRAQTTAVTAERRLLDCIDSIHDGFAIFDNDLRLVTANTAFRAAFPGVDIEEGVFYTELLIAAGESGVIEIGDAPDKPSVRDWVAQMLARWDDGAGLPATLKLSSGRWKHLHDKRTRDGDVVILLQDITDEMRMRAAIEALSDGFALFDRDESLIMANDRYRQLFPELADVIQPGTTITQIFQRGLDLGLYPEGIGREAEHLQERLEWHRSAGGETSFQTDSGRWIRRHDRITPDGGRVCLRGDITDLKAQADALEQARSAAEAANRAKSAFLANMTHEIRTPMNGVVGMAELLCETALTEDQRLFAETIRSSGEALLVIINDILDYSKIEAERLTFHPEPFDLERTIHEVAMLLQPKARSKGVDLLIDFDMFLPTRFVGDPGRIRQVLTNLIGNAVKFTEKGHVIIRVVGLESAPGHQQLHINIEDTGIGIAEADLSHVFGEFNQVESAANRKFEGTGLGLAITKQLVERMGGAVWVDSELGRGSNFGFRLPLPVAEDAEPAPVPHGIQRALVVDDQFINRTILERQLAPCGIDVTLCRSGADALATLAVDAGFDVIITDHLMPDMDGIALATAIRATHASIPIVLLSSAIIPDLDRQVISTVLQKPILRAELYRRLHSLTVQAPPQPPVEEPALPVALRPMRVLTAEDNRTNQLVFRKMVQDLPIDLTFANNGVEAVELFKTLQPDLIFMDISMPEMDGRDAARAIRLAEGGSARRTPIIALTAHSMEGDQENILAAGIDEYMTKPLRKTAITAALAAHCPKGAHPIEGDQAAASSA